MRRFFCYGIRLETSDIFENKRLKFGKCWEKCEESWCFPGSSLFSGYNQAMFTAGFYYVVLDHCFCTTSWLNNASLDVFLVRLSWIVSMHWLNQMASLSLTREGSLMAPCQQSCLIQTLGEKQRAYRIFTLWVLPVLDWSEFLYCRFSSVFLFWLLCWCDVLLRKFGTISNRLFLSMDPKHGEISRAMRNRGVEICILGEVSVALPISVLICRGSYCYFQDELKIKILSFMEAQCQPFSCCGALSLESWGYLGSHFISIDCVLSASCMFLGWRRRIWQIRHEGDAAWHWNCRPNSYRCHHLCSRKSQTAIWKRGTLWHRSPPSDRFACFPDDGTRKWFSRGSSFYYVRCLRPDGTWSEEKAGGDFCNIINKLLNMVPLSQYD